MASLIYNVISLFFVTLVTEPFNVNELEFTYLTIVRGKQNAQQFNITYDFLAT